MKMRHYDITAVAIIAVLSLVVLYRQFFPLALFSCQLEDTFYYLNWTRQFADSLSNGILYPRWMPESHIGYGNPTFIFYSPLSIYLAAILKILFGDIVLAVNLVKFIELFLSGVFMYLFARDLWGNGAGLAAALVYMVLPYRIFELYCMGLYASKLAYVFFPIILYFTKRAVKEQSAGPATAGLAISYGLLILTHILSAYMFTPVFLAYGLYSSERGQSMRAALRLSLAGVLGLSLAAFYLLPALVERPFVHFEMLTRFRFLQYWNYYLFWFSGKPEYHDLTYASNIKQTVIYSCLLGLSVYILSNILVRLKEKSGASFFLAVCAVTLFMMSSASGFLWKMVPGLKMLQFPARLSSVTTFSLSALAGAGIWSAWKKGISSRRVFISVWGILFAVSAFTVMKYNLEIISKSCVSTREEVASFPNDVDVLEYLPKDVSSPEQIPEVGWQDWLRDKLKKTPPEKVIPLSGDPVSINIEKWGAEKRVFDVNGSNDAELRVRTFNYPGWRGSIDGVPVVLSSEKDSGAILLNVPGGRHRVTLTFSDTPDRAWGKALSALAAAFVLYIFVRSRKKTCYN